MTPSANTQNILLLIVRVFTGAFMIYHGLEIFDAQKMAEYASWDTWKNLNGKVMTYLGKGGEFVGGILLTLGLFTRIGSLILIATMAYIPFFIGNSKIFAEDQHPFLFVLLGFVFFAIGGGKYSLDGLKKSS